MGGCRDAGMEAGSLWRRYCGTAKEAGCFYSMTMSYYLPSDPTVHGLPNKAFS